MITITHITLILLLINQSVSKDSENDWTFGIADIPTSTLGWLYDQTYTSSKLGSESSEGGSNTNVNHSEEEKEPKLEVVNSDEPLDELKSAKEVDDIINMINDSNEEEKKQYVPFLENLQDTINNNPARYVKVFIKNMRHIVDLGIFNGDKRRQNAQQVESTLQIIKEILYKILTSVFDFICGNVEDGMRELQRLWSKFEQTRHGDHRVWTEEKALEKLNELENHYKTMSKDVVISDVTSLAMQPLFKVSTYEKITEFLRTLKEAGYEHAALQKVFNYVEYKMQFSKVHNIR